MDFDFSVDHRIKVKESEELNKNLDQAEELKTVTEYKSDSATNNR